MEVLDIINFWLLIILSVLLIMKIALYFYRKGKVGGIIGFIRSSKERFVFLYLGIFMLILGAFDIYIVLYVKKIASEPYIWIMPWLIGLHNIEAFMNSKIYIGEKGVSASKIPFFIPKSELKSYMITDHKLVLNRKNKKEYSVLFDTNDIIKMENAIAELCIPKE